MMAQSIDVVINPQFIDPNPLEIIIDKYPGRNLVVTDMNHKLLLKVRPYDGKLHRQLMLLDAHDEPIALLREKNLSMHSRWNAYKGESKADSDILFSAKKEHMIQFKTNICVMLAKKTCSNDNCDLRIKGSWSKGTCSIYKGDSSTEIAKMHRPKTVKYAKDKFTVRIQPNMDYACVVALFAIVNAMENPYEVIKGSAETAGAMLDIANSVISSTSN